MKIKIVTKVALSIMLRITVKSISILLIQLKIFLENEHNFKHD